jgi:hypothetical protein
MKCHRGRRGGFIFSSCAGIHPIHYGVKKYLSDRERISGHIFSLARMIHGPVGEWHEARESRAHAVSQTRDGLLSRFRVEKRRTREVSRWIKKRA